MSANSGGSLAMLTHCNPVIQGMAPPEVREGPSSFKRAVRETRMSLEVCVLASGSAGNCTVVRTPAGTLLIDAGIGPRTAAQRLAGTGASVSDVSGICLTHLDHDHFNRNWLATVLGRDVNLYCHESRVDDLL